MQSNTEHFQTEFSPRYCELLVQFLAQFSIELVSIDRPIKCHGSALSLNIRKNDCDPRTGVFSSAIARLRHDFPSRDHVPCTTRCGSLCSSAKLIQQITQISAHFFFTVSAQISTICPARFPIFMLNAQLQSRIVNFDFPDPYHRSAFAKIIPHPDVTGQESVRRRLKERGCGRDRGSGARLFARRSICLRYGDGGAEKRRTKHDCNNGFHARCQVMRCSGNAVPYP